MEGFDVEKAARVWQRVAARQVTDNGKELLPLIMGAWTAAAAYRSLAQRMGGRAGRMLRRLFEDERSAAACLRGLYMIDTGRVPEPYTPAPVQGTTDAALRKCYGWARQSLAQYEAHAADPVFAKLAQQKREHCKVLLELIGSLRV